MDSRLPTTTLAMIVLLAWSTASVALPISHEDLWDVAQGTQLTGSSPTYPGTWHSDASNVLGGTVGVPPVSTTLEHHVIFEDLHDAGQIHWIEWVTPTLVEVSSLNLVALHDNPVDARDIRHRGILSFRLYADHAGSWDLVYELPNADPNGDLLYGGGTRYPSSHYLELEATFSPVTANSFRAEFIQYGPIWGPRIIELDGYGATVPEPCALVLFGLGLAGLGVVARRTSRT